MPTTSPNATLSEPRSRPSRTTIGSARSTPIGRDCSRCRILVERVAVRDREVEMIDWTPPARPFFEKQRECPQGDSNP
jgi:hypothetical protein